MSKTYKGYELIKLINDRELKTGTEIKVKMGSEYITTITYEEFGLKWKTGEFDTSILCSNSASFELIEDEINIQEIEELKIGTITTEDKLKINEIIKVLKQLDKKIKEKEQC